MDFMHRIKGELCDQGHTDFTITCINSGFVLRDAVHNIRSEIGGQLGIDVKAVSVPCDDSELASFNGSSGFVQMRFKRVEQV